jgi:L-aspartate oxidase
MCDRIPVAPAAHYMVGGVRTDLHAETNIRNLYIFGELASSGIMGANRLASNSLIECLVFGKRAIEASRSHKEEQKIPSFSTRYHCNVQYATEYVELKKEISKIMTLHAGIIRNAQLLQQGLEQLEQLESKIPNEADEYYSLLSHNLITVARLIIRSALYRQESRGGHFREDFPQTNDAYLYHIVQQKDQEIRTIPVKTEC